MFVIYVLIMNVNMHVYWEIGDKAGRPWTGDMPHGVPLNSHAILYKEPIMQNSDNVFVVC